MNNFEVITNVFQALGLGCREAKRILLGNDELLSSPIDPSTIFSPSTSFSINWAFADNNLKRQ